MIHRLRKVAKINMENFLNTWIENGSSSSNINNDQWEYIKQEYPNCIYNGDVYRFISFDISNLLKNIPLTNEDIEKDCIPGDAILNLVSDKIQNNDNFCSSSISLNGCKFYVENSCFKDGIFIKFKSNNGINLQLLTQNFTNLLDDRTTGMVEGEQEIITKANNDYETVGFMIDNTYFSIDSVSIITIEDLNIKLNIPN